MSGDAKSNAKPTATAARSPKPGPAATQSKSKAGAALRFGSAEFQDELRCSAIHKQRRYQFKTNIRLQGAGGTPALLIFRRTASLLLYFSPLPLRLLMLLAEGVRPSQGGLLLGR